MEKQETMDSKKTLDTIDPSEALQILKMLCQEDTGIKKRVEDMFLNQVREIDVSEIADEVFSDLDFLDVEDLWDRSGSHRDGYTDTGDAALEMIEDVLEPHLKSMQRLHSLGMFQEEMRYCMGVVSGLHMFENEATTDFKDWSVDIPGEQASEILTEWKKSCHAPDLLAEMEKFEKTSYSEEGEEGI
ncbi:MAG: hypothetical protein ACHQUC_06030 [Chlamydiales bacterium]